MIPQNPLRRSENEAILHAWPSEIARSAKTPWLAQALAARVTDLLPRVARCHAQLRTLPRRTRRAWQRQLARSSDLTAILEDWSQRRAGRELQRQLARSVAGAALLLALAHGVGHAATITVNTNIPAIDAADGKCSLIEAIENANGTATHADCALGSVGADTIVLPKAPHALSAVNNSTYYATGLPVITTQITIEGNGAEITRKGGAPRFRLIAVGATGDLTLKNVTLSGGNAEFYGGAIQNGGILTIQNSTISGNAAVLRGGGIHNGSTYRVVVGTLTIENSTISGNTVGKGTYFYDSLLGSGGGIANYGTVTITNSTISGNQAAGHVGNCGGGILNSGDMTIDNSTISRNRGDGQSARGGGITNYGALTITNSTISGNRTLAKFENLGGGIKSTFGSLLIQNSTISGNKAGRAIPGSVFGSRTSGGGIFTASSTTIENSTISGNVADGKYGSGGGIVNFYTLTIKNSTISGNYADFGVYSRPDLGYGVGGIGNFGDLFLHRTLISGNKAAATFEYSAPPVPGRPRVSEVYNSGGTVTADDFNLFGLKGTAGTNFSPGPTDIVPGPAVGLGAILGGLRDNGGPTKTRALTPGSPAVNAVPSSDPACTGTDQRGVTRPQGSDCDIGSFELE